MLIFTFKSYNLSFLNSNYLLIMNIENTEIETLFNQINNSFDLVRRCL
jgi:hypothetical protein